MGWCLGRSLAAQLCDLPERGDSLRASRDLNCIRLVATAARDSSIVAHVELAWMPGPFTVATTADGRSVYAPVMTIRGLPPGRYVAWAAPPAMFPMQKLGLVHNGITRLPPVALDPFVVLVTRERSTSVAAPTGPPILRGQSPSSRLQPADFLRFALGATTDTAPMTMPMSGGGWTTVPVPPGLTMLPSEMALRPPVAPFLPSGPAPQARAGEVVHLASGDTLALSAGLVERSVQGHRATMYAYDGQQPGPRIVVHQGDSIVVDFTNRLPMPTSVHWHGIRLDSRFDGIDPVAPGGHFVYHLRFPDPGVYWYHPHVREDMEQNLGLYGNIVVEPPIPVARREEFLMLTDLAVTEAGLVPYGREAATHALMGRFGNVLGAFRLAARRHEVVQFALTNVANARVFNLSFPGARMKVVGGDAGMYEHEAWVPSIVIAPAERYIVQVRFDRGGDVPLLNRTIGLDHVYGRFVPVTDTLGVVHVDETPVAGWPSFDTAHANPTARASIAPYRRYASRPPDRTLLLTLRTHDLPFVTRQVMRLDSSYFAPVEWVGSMPHMNWASTSDQVRWVLRDPATGRENMDINWRFRRDTVIKLRLVNDRRTLHGMQHPIHVHGQRFLVLAVNDVPNPDLVWKDTVLVPAGSAVDILLDLSNPGRWMLHCHIAEHLAAQMMTAFTVE